MFGSGWKKIHPRILETLADNSKSADPSEKILLATVETKELVETPQEDTLIAFDEMWSYHVLEVLDSVVGISQSVTIEQWFIHSSVTNKAILSEGPSFSASRVVMSTQSSTAAS